MPLDRAPVSSDQALAILEDANDVVYLHDLDGRFLWVNRAAERLYGMDRDAFLRASIRDLVEPEHLDVALQHLQEKARGETERSDPYELLTRDAAGRRVWVEVSTRIVSLPDGRQAVQGIARDISARKTVETGQAMVQDLVPRLLDAAGLEDAVAVTLSTLAEGIGWPYAEAWQVTEEGLVPCGPWVAPASATRFVRLSRSMAPEWYGLPHRALHDRRPLLSSDIAHDPRFHRAAAAQAAGLRSAYAVPVQARDRVLAVLVLMHSVPVRRDDLDLAVIQAAAAHLGSVLVQKKQRDALRHHRSWLAQVAALDSHPVLVTDAQGAVLSANGPFLAACGVSFAGPAPLRYAGEAFLSRLSDRKRFLAWAERFHSGETLVLDGVRHRRRSQTLTDADDLVLGHAWYFTPVP